MQGAQHVWIAMAVIAATARMGMADDLRGVVVDQIAAAVPGATVELLEGTAVAASVTTSAEGVFVLPACATGSRVRVTMPGFDVAIVTCREAERIVLALAHGSDTATVTAATAGADSPTSALVGAHLSREAAQRLPTGGQHAREALPLLPSVVRGPDGLLHIDGVRPHEAPLMLDGFDVADPATGVSSIDLPLESVKSVEVLRDPMTVMFGRALGSLASIESRTGGDDFEAGVQGFVPRPRLTGGGFGRLEGFSPRGFAAGRGGGVRYLAAGEFDFDRIPVPGVTTSSGSPDRRAVGGTLFARLDVEWAPAHTLRVEALWSPWTRSFDGLSPLRVLAATRTLQDRDGFAGIVDQRVLAGGDIVTLRVAWLSHRTDVRPTTTGQAEISALGWSGSNFSSLDRNTARLQGTVSWQRVLASPFGSHDLTLETSADARRLSGTISENDVDIREGDGAVVRAITFGPPASLRARDRSIALVLRDLWQANGRLQIDAGVRGDGSALAGGALSARLGLRYLLTTEGATVIKGGVGRFVGTMPLSVPAFGKFPLRVDRTTNHVFRLQPEVGALSLPRALAANARVERQLGGGWEALLGVAVRQGSRLPTVDVRPGEGRLVVASAGHSTYREAEVAMRHTWGTASQVFASYVRSSARGDVNDFSGLFGSGDVEILQPAGSARLAADAPHRFLAWATFDLPAGFGLSPVLEWHSGFPYSVLDVERAYVGPPNSRSFPPFFSLDAIVYKALKVKGRSVKLNVQLFNVTNHFNPRDVFAVAPVEVSRAFANSVGLTVRGDIAVNW